jgi:hypothetical protein
MNKYTIEVPDFDPIYYKDNDAQLVDVVISEWKIEEEYHQNSRLKNVNPTSVQKLDYPYYPVVDHRIYVGSTEQLAFMVDQNYTFYSWGDPEMKRLTDTKKFTFTDIATTYDCIGMLNAERKLEIIGHTPIPTNLLDTQFKKIFSIENVFVLWREDSTFEVVPGGEQDARSGKLEMLFNNESDFSQNRISKMELIDVQIDQCNIFLISTNILRVYRIIERGNGDLKFNKSSTVSIYNKMISTLYYNLYKYENKTHSFSSYANIKQIVSNSLGYVILFNNGTVNIKYYGDGTGTESGTGSTSYKKPSSFWLRNVSYLVANDRIFSAFSIREKAIVTWGKFQKTGNVFYVKQVFNMRQVVATIHRHYAIDMNGTLYEWGQHSSEIVGSDESFMQTVTQPKSIEFLFSTRNILGISTKQVRERTIDAYNPDLGLFCNRVPLKHTVKRCVLRRHISDGFGRDYTYEVQQNPRKSFFPNTHTMTKKELYRYASRYRYR